MKICLIIPTLNEEKNIIKLFNNIKKTKIKLDILFVDDNSSDQTQKLILLLKNKYKNIDYLFRKKKIGIGSAHKDGIKLPGKFSLYLALLGFFLLLSNTFGYAQLW